MAKYSLALHNCSASSRQCRSSVPRSWFVDHVFARGFVLFGFGLDKVGKFFEDGQDLWDDWVFLVCCVCAVAVLFRTLEGQTNFCTVSTEWVTVFQDFGDSDGATGAECSQECVKVLNNWPIQFQEYFNTNVPIHLDDSKFI